MRKCYEKELFWADQKAVEIICREKFYYLHKPVPKFDEYVVKTSASISGVLHIGRLSDTIRSESVVKALTDKGYNARLIWVAEDMDALRKIPEGVPEKFSEYVGLPVTVVPDPSGCHSSYAEHHIAEYLKVLHEFVSVDIEKYSMREEYRRGSFRPYIKTMLEKTGEIIEIQNKYRKEPLKQDWLPWTPICENCGKIITTKVKEFRDGRIVYRCEDYKFETQTAKGCRYEGENDPLKDEGKLMWKSEWAAQWARWQVTAEGAGKEYVVPTSAWWINAEIAERILNFPSPVPIFYEHLMIDGQKMSASMGNVVYPHEWLNVAPPQLLKFFYNKKLMKTRSFSWRELPNLYDEYDYCTRVYFGKEKIANEKEAAHMKRLYEISQLGKIEEPVNLPFSHAAMVAQVFAGEDAIVESLKRSGHYEKQSHQEILKRINFARNWALKYAPPEAKVNLIDAEKVREQLTEKQKKFLKSLASMLAEKELSAEEIHNQIYVLSKGMNLQLGEAFQAIYLAVLGSLQGPKVGTLITSLDKKWVIERFAMG